MMTVKQYSLLDYSLSITLRSSTSADATETVFNVPIGGAGNYLGSIKFTKSTDNVSKFVDATGAGVFAFTNDHSGTVDIEISQVSDAIADIITQLADKYHGDKGFWRDALIDIVMNKGTQPVIEATNCMLVKMPDFVVANEPAQRTFSFLAMEIQEMKFNYV